MERDNAGLQEMALLTMKQLCVRENNAFKFLFHDTVPKLLLILELETTASLHEPAAFALEQVSQYLSFWEVMGVFHWGSAKRLGPVFTNILILRIVLF